jgi:hypothetical protein
MKTAHSSILLFGREPEILATRQWVLESRGYGVAVTHSLAEIATVPKDTPIRLALLCHTLSPADRTAAAALTSTRWPGAICRALTQATRMPAGILGRLMHTCEGSTDLVAMVRMLLREEPAAPPKPSRRGKAA